MRSGVVVVERGEVPGATLFGAVGVGGVPVRIGGLREGSFAGAGVGGPVAEASLEGGEVGFRGGELGVGDALARVAGRRGGGRLGAELVLGLAHGALRLERLALARRLRALHLGRTVRPGRGGAHRLRGCGVRGRAALARALSIRGGRLLLALVHVHLRGLDQEFLLSLLQRRATLGVRVATGTRGDVAARGVPGESRGGIHGRERGVRARAALRAGEGRRRQENKSAKTVPPSTTCPTDRRRPSETSTRASNKRSGRRNNNASGAPDARARPSRASGRPACSSRFVRARASFARVRRARGIPRREPPNPGVMESTHPSRAATRIQASFRGHLVRRDVVDAARRDFEEIARRVERAALGHLPANVPFASARAPRLGPAKAEASAPRERARAFPILATRDPTPSTRADDTTNPTTSSSGSATDPANGPRGPVRPRARRRRRRETTGDPPRRTRVGARRARRSTATPSKDATRRRVGGRRPHPREGRPQPQIENKPNRRVRDRTSDGCESRSRRGGEADARTRAFVIG